MSFLNPLALTGLALIGLPLLIHLLSRRRAGRLAFPTLRYLRETPSFSLRPRRIQEPWLLALRVLAIILLVLGIARPFFTPRAPAQGLRLILLDASLSMRAEGRAAAAREQARAIIRAMPQDERAALLTFSSRASVLVGFTSDRQELLAAIERYEPESGAADFSSGFAAAAALIERTAPAPAVIDLISDFQRANLDQLAQQSMRPPATTFAHAIGTTIERNAFLLDEAATKNGRGIEISATEIVSTADGQSGARRSWTIDESAGERPEIFWQTQANGQLTGHLSTLVPDDFDADDERFFAFTPPLESRVLLIESDAETSLYAGAALEAAVSNPDKAHSPVEQTPHSLVERQRQLPAHAADLSAYALVALTLHGPLGADQLRLLSDYAEAGGTVWLSLARDADTEQLNALAATTEGRALPFKSLRRLSGAGSLQLLAADTLAPPLNSLTGNAFEMLSAVTIHDGYAFEPRDDAATLMRWSDDTAAFVSTRSGRFLLLGTSTESAASGLGSSPAYASLAFGILRRAAAPDGPLSYTLGEAIDTNLTPLAEVSITNAAAHTYKVRARDLRERPQDIFREAGIYRLETEKGVRFVALNTPVSESERALFGADEAQRLLKETGPTMKSGGEGWREAAERVARISVYFLGAAFILLLAELFIRARRRRNVEEKTTTVHQQVMNGAEHLEEV